MSLQHPQPITAQADTPFNWRDYVEVSADFTAGERQQVEASLERLSGYENGNDRAMIEAGAERYGHKLLVAPSTEDNFHQNGIIGINIDTINHLRIRNEDGTLSPTSLDATLEHELYHATQDAADSRVALATMERQIRSDGHIPEKDIEPLMQEMTAMQQQLDTNKLFSHLRDGEETRSLTYKHIETYPEGSYRNQYKDEIYIPFQAGFGVALDINTGLPNMRKKPLITSMHSQNSIGQRSPFVSIMIT